MAKQPDKYVSSTIVVDDFGTAGEKHLRRLIAAVKNTKVSDGDPIPCNAETMQFICAAFDEILQGVPAEKALKLQTKQGTKRAHKKEVARERSMNIAIMVEERVSQGEPKDEARQAVADKLNLKYPTIREHHKAWKGLAKNFFVMQKRKKKK